MTATAWIAEVTRLLELGLLEADVETELLVAARSISEELVSDPAGRIAMARLARCAALREVRDRVVGFAGTEAAWTIGGVELSVDRSRRGPGWRTLMFGGFEYAPPGKLSPVIAATWHVLDRGVLTLTTDELAFRGPAGHLRAPWGVVSAVRRDPEALEVGFAGSGWFRLQTNEAWFAENVASNLSRAQVGGQLVSTYR